MLEASSLEAGPHYGISLERFDHLPEGHSLHCELPFNKSVVPERSSKLKRLVTFAIIRSGLLQGMAVYLVGLLNMADITV